MATPPNSASSRNAKNDFTKRNTKLFGVSVGSVDSHRSWSADIAETQGQVLNYPLVGDAERRVANLYGMICPNAIATTAVQAVFVIAPDKTIKLTLTHPATIGPSVDQIVLVPKTLPLGASRASRPPSTGRTATT